MNRTIYDRYDKKFSIRPPIISEQPEENLGIAVVIPCFNEPEIEAAIYSLNAAESPVCDVEVIVVVNQSKTCEDTIARVNRYSIEALKLLSKSTWFKLHIISELQLLDKIAGVGTARKIGMDEALYRFSILERNGVIACFDADSLAEGSYFIELEGAFKKGISGCSIHFEHDLHGPDDRINTAITDYELFLRYYNLAINYAELPYGFYTVGSSMAVSCEAYVKIGGMNKRKAGEDFYFLHKVIQLGNFMELTSTTVFPSSRMSERVPFGTGKAIKTRIANGAETYQTYSLEGFTQLKNFARKLKRFDTNDWDQDLVSFLPSDFKVSLSKIRKTYSSDSNYVNAAFRLFSAFRTMKYLHFKRDQGFTAELNTAVKDLLIEMDIDFDARSSNLELLSLLRKLDRMKMHRVEQF